MKNFRIGDLSLLVQAVIDMLQRKHLEVEVHFTLLKKKVHKREIKFLPPTFSKILQRLMR